MHIPAILSDAFSLALNRTTTTIITTTETIIIDRLLIKGKWRGGLVSTRENRNVQVSKWQADDDVTKGSDKIYFSIL